MPTASERMLELSALSSGNTARAHFLSIQQGTGQLNIYGEINTKIMPDINVVIDDSSISVNVDNNEISVTLEPEINVQVEC